MNIMRNLLVISILAAILVSALPQPMRSSGLEDAALTTAPGGMSEAHLQSQETAIIGNTLPIVDGGTVTIIELGLTSQIENGHFEFRNISLPREPTLISLEIRVDGFRPLTQENSFMLTEGSQPSITVPLTPGEEPLFTDACPGLLATPSAELSAAAQEQARLCAELPVTGSGMGGSVSSRLPAFLLALGGALAIAAGGALRFNSRTRA